MTRLMQRARETVNDVDLPDTSELRARILEAVEQAMDKVEEVVADAPSPRETAKRVGHSRAVEGATAFVVASLPAAVGALRSRAKRRHLTRAARLTPVVVRSHPALFGVAVVGGAAVGVGVARYRRKATRDDDALHSQLHDPQPSASSFDLEDQVARMEDEGPELGSSPARDGVGNGRRFVRGSSDR